ncbi:MAG: hypothetical protein C0399_05735 [Syntrophus sp. (in: bacteria)]|nr:hypothetical protein [Syntrophus sp. (in: bacteria)]
MNKYLVNILYKGRTNNQITRQLSILLGSATYSDFDQETGENILEFQITTDKNIILVKEQIEALFEGRQYFSIKIEGQR